MGSSFELVLLLSLAGLTGIIGLRFVWISHGPPSLWTVKHTAVDPFVSPSLWIKVYDSSGPFIPMPNHLKTQDEMVAWMTKELPKLTAAPPE